MMSFISLGLMFPLFYIFLQMHLLFNIARSIALRPKARPSFFFAPFARARSFSPPNDSFARARWAFPFFIVLRSISSRALPLVARIFIH